MVGFNFIGNDTLTDYQIGLAWKGFVIEFINSLLLLTCWELNLNLQKNIYVFK